MRGGGFNRQRYPYIKSKGQWRSLNRAVDKAGHSINFLLTAQRDEPAAKHFPAEAIRRHGVPEKHTSDRSEANAAVIRRYHDEHGRAIIIVQVKYLNHLVEQDPRGVKRPTRPMLGLKSSEAAQGILVGIELMHRLRNGQLECGSDQGLTPAAPFYSLAASSPAQLASRDPR